MKKPSKQAIKEILNEKDIPILAVADAETINQQAPPGFRAEDHLPGARSMLIFARPLPIEVFDVSRDPKLIRYKRAFFENYKLMDEAARTVAGFLEQQGFPSLPLPAYSPLVFNQGEPWGKMSFKHAAQLAGLGKIGRNTLFIHPDKEIGNTLRFGGALTTLALPAGKKTEFKTICPPTCSLCIDACPVNALSPKGIDKTRCMSKCIKSPFMPPLFAQKGFRWMGQKSKSFSKFLEWFASAFFEDYGIRCVKCLTVCPHFPRN
jgi:epoxyqueuosine reductase